MPDSAQFLGMRRNRILVLVQPDLVCKVYISCGFSIIDETLGSLLRCFYVLHNLHINSIANRRHALFSEYRPCGSTGPRLILGCAQDPHG